MNTLEIILLICGCIFITVSFIMNPGGGKAVSEGNPEDAGISDAQMENIRSQVDAVVAQRMEIASEQTEAQLDKLSAAKVLELNEFADTVLQEINRNHNETVFLYDMLNEKAKELKNTVKDVNIAKQQVEKLQEEAAASLAPPKKEAMEVREEEKPKARRSRKTAEKKDTTAVEKEAPKEGAKEEAKEESAPKKRGRKKKTEEAATVRQEDAASAVENAADASEAEEQESQNRDAAPLDKTQVILSLSEEGKDVKEIARELGMGIGEVNLILGLYK